MKIKTLLTTIALSSSFAVPAATNQNTAPEIFSVSPETCKSIHSTWNPIYYGDVKLTQIWEGKALVFDNDIIVYTGAQTDLSNLEYGDKLRDIISGTQFLVKIADMKMPTVSGFKKEFELYRVTNGYNKFLACSNRLWDEQRFKDMMRKNGLEFEIVE